MLNIFDIIDQKYFIEIDSKVYGKNLKNLKKINNDCKSKIFCIRICSN